MKIVFATGNPGKLQEAAAILGEGFELVTPAEVGITEEIPETGTTLRANSQQKADYIYKKTGLDCFADDSGLEVDILGGAPGVETARYAGPERDANANMDKLLSEMARREKEAAMARTNGISTANATRSARFRTSVTLIVGGVHHFFDGVMEGHIATEKHGKGGFGYDPIFVPEGYTQTNAELGDKVKNAISHRSKALRAMAEYLREQH
ncbi:MAG: RdgB/HAM1 family non-canonical purine NTP pyrophosphatase [Candidatus Cryptobacteroides sp.]|nr:RdgB/HAM1 family non-canonical purine NTP pyrophosphatase [Candidatus Cryptobacteroides sp.]MEE3465980.1 RdgB/HAM1 family non-canonical purine NTP pyrophosphatase [Candidatus Cryptobacteroides sp.]